MPDIHLHILLSALHHPRIFHFPRNLFDMVLRLGHEKIRSNLFDDGSIIFLNKHSSRPARAFHQIIVKNVLY